MGWLNRLLGRQEPWEDPWDDRPRGLVLKGGMTPPNPPPAPVTQAAPPAPPTRREPAPEALAVEVYDTYRGRYEWFVIPAHGRVRREQRGTDMGQPCYDEYYARGSEQSEEEARRQGQKAADKMAANGHGNPTQRWVQEA